MSDDLGLIGGEDEDEDLDTLSAHIHSPPELHATLTKWTNYIHGWQNRYIILKNGTLSYYKSENDTHVGCRGSISIRKANIEVSEF